MQFEKSISLPSKVKQVIELALWVDENDRNYLQCICGGEAEFDKIISQITERGEENDLCSSSRPCN